MLHRCLLALWFAICAASESADDSELLLVQSLTRHGNRAPDPTITTSCPRLYPTEQAVVDMFGAEPAGLTNMGMNQMHNAGSLLRRRYVEGGFVPQDYNPHQKQWYFQARGQPRHQQSCAAMGQGMFPPGTGPVTYPGRQQPIAISSWSTATDTTLYPPTKPCSAMMGAENAQWTAGYGRQLVADNLDIIRALEATCGADIQNATDPAATTKDIVDAILFLKDEYLPTPPGLSPQMQSRAVFLAQHMLMSKLFGTPDRETMWLADFPAALLARMDCALRPAAAAPKPCPLRYAGYVSSRELLFVLGQTLGIRFDAPALPPTALPPAATLTWELRRRGGVVGEPFVAVWLTIPPRQQAEVNQTRSRQMAMGACGGKHECPLSEFRAIFADLTAATGTWRAICSASADGEVAARSDGGDGGGGGGSGISTAATTALCGVLGLVAGAALGGRTAKRRAAAAGAQTSPSLLNAAASPADGLQSYGSIRQTV